LTQVKAAEFLQNATKSDLPAKTSTEITTLGDNFDVLL
jgi:hypothetical protein